MNDARVSGQDHLRAGRAGRFVPYGPFFVHLLPGMERAKSYNFYKL
jgi:hypothetical protein